jgi:hypothetical protein
MQTQKLLAALGMATLGAISVATSAEAVTFTAPTTFPIGYQNVLQLEGRFADNSGALRAVPGQPTVIQPDTTEVRLRGAGAINASGNYVGNPVTPTQNNRAWTSGQTVPLRLSYVVDPVNQSSIINYSFGNGNNRVSNNPGATFSFSDGIGGLFDSILIRTDAGANSTANLSNIRITNQSGGPGSITSANSDTDFLLLSGFNPANSFELTANVNFAWTGTPAPNALRYQINVGSASAIPTPALLPGIIGLGVAAWRKRESKAVAES